MNTISFTAAAFSDKGKIRGNNEDNFYFNGIHLNAENRDESNAFSDNPSGDDLMFGVFDGMGGEALGEEASLIAAETVKKYHEKIQKHQAANCDRTILRVVEEANVKICDKMVETGERRIGTTFALLTVQEDKAKVYNVGDSRVYLYRNKVLKQVSMDDTTAQRLVNMGVITKEQAKTHEDRHKLTQHLGIFKDEMVVEPHISNEIEIKKGDRFILCSDGLTDMVEDERIAEILRTTKGCQQAAKKLVDEALNNGGRDNVTVVMIEAESASVLKPAQGAKKNFFLPCIIALLLVIAGIFGVTQVVGRLKGDDKISVKSLTWASQISEIAVGEQGSFMVQVEPMGAEEEVTWETSDPSVLTISQKGIYTALAQGKVKVTARAGKETCTLDVTVLAPVSDIKLEKNTLKIKVGESAKFAYTIVPAEAPQTAWFASSDVSIAGVSEDGTVTAVAEGQATVTVSAGTVSKEVKILVTSEKEEEAKPDVKKKTEKTTEKPSKSPSAESDKSSSPKPGTKPSEEPSSEPEKETSKVTPTPSDKPVSEPAQTPTPNPTQTPTPAIP